MTRIIESIYGHIPSLTVFVPNQAQLSFMHQGRRRERLLRLLLGQICRRQLL